MDTEKHRAVIRYEVGESFEVNGQTRWPLMEIVDGQRRRWDVYQSRQAAQAAANLHNGRQRKKDAAAREQETRQAEGRAFADRVGALNGALPDTAGFSVQWSGRVDVEVSVRAGMLERFMEQALTDAGASAFDRITREGEGATATWNVGIRRYAGER